MGLVEQTVEALEHVRTHPVEFIEKRLGYVLRWPDGRPDEEAVSMVLAARDGKSLALAGGHSTRKDFTCALIDVWKLFAYPGTVIMLTGPTMDQVKATQLHYIKEILAKAQVPRDWYVPMKESIEFPGSRSVIFCRTTSSRDENQGSMARLTGLHRERTILHITEATSVPNAIYEQLTTLGAHARMQIFATMNAINAGPEHWSRKLFRQKPGGWYTANLSSYESPYCRKSWIEERIADGWVPGTVLHKSRILGVFPDAEENVLIPEQWVIDAQAAEFETGKMLTALGVDVSGPGVDLTVAAELWERVITPLMVLPRRGGKNDVTDTAEWIRRRVVGYGLPAGRCKIDVCGLGQGVVDILQRDGLRVVGVNAAEKAQSAMFHNRRAEMYWYLRTLLQGDPPGVRLPRDSGLLTELSDIHFEDRNGRILIEPKEKIKERIGRSPDRADAVALCMYMASPGGLGSFQSRRAQTLCPAQKITVQAIIARSSSRLPAWMWR